MSTRHSTAGEVTVYVVTFKDRPNLYMRYRDPISGRSEVKSAGTRNRRQAEKEAAKWEEDLREGRYNRGTKISWADFRERYEDEKLASLADATETAAASAFNHLERVIGPRRLADVTSDVMSRFQARLRKEGLSDASIASYLRHLKASLRWAVKQGLMAKAPEIEMPKRGRKKGRAMHGRPITGEEFDRMIVATPLVRKLEPEKWVRLLRGIWLSGLRLGESLALSWDEDADLTVRLDGAYPKIRIYAEAEKGKKDRLLPITPDFAELLYAVPEEDRHGLVFGITTSIKRVSRYISAIGERAGVVVSKAEGKFASAHDLRRSFGTRWAMRVKPATLKLMMRHKTIETTMDYYVDLDSDDVAAELWGADRVGSTFGSTRPDSSVPLGRPK
jgi:integrase